MTLPTPFEFFMDYRPPPAPVERARRMYENMRAYYATTGDLMAGRGKQTDGAYMLRYTGSHGGVSKIVWEFLYQFQDYLAPRRDWPMLLTDALDTKPDEAADLARFRYLRGWVRDRVLPLLQPMADERGVGDEWKAMIASRDPSLFPHRGMPEQVYYFLTEASEEWTPYAVIHCAGHVLYQYTPAYRWAGEGPLDPKRLAVARDLIANALGELIYD